MKKICPYCGRIGSLGTVCKGCGYVYLESDRTAPKDHRSDTVSQPVSPESYLSAGSDKLEPQMPVCGDPERIVLYVKKKSVWKLLLGILLSLYGTYRLLKTTHLYFHGDLLGGLAGNSVAWAFILCGLLLFRSGLLQESNRGVWRYLRILLVLAVLLALGIPVFLFFIILA